MTADVYGQGKADAALGEALAGYPRDSYCLVGMLGHDFYEGTRNGSAGYPRFTDPALRSPAEYRQFLRMACERSLAQLPHRPLRPRHAAQSGRNGLHQRGGLGRPWRP